MTVRTNCICASALTRETFSRNFDAMCCSQCGSYHFVAAKTGGDTAPEFVYNEATEKYTRDDYLHGKQLRWAHKELLKQDWSNCKILEIGCFNGFFLDELRNIGADVYGFDVNRNALSVGERLFGLEGRLSETIDEISKKGPFDAIFCIDVLEHMNNPEDVMQKIGMLLTSSGRVVIAGPILERRFHDKSDYPPHHAWWFSPEGLDLFIKKSGFDITTKMVQHDGLLMLRNIAGKFIHRNAYREYYGETLTVSPNVQVGIAGWIYSIVAYVGTALFTLLRIPYCSALFIAKKSSDGHIG